ncbi:hypothetical protein OQA88_3390 [Cercophora sp. LCS_1]
MAARNAFAKSDSLIPRSVYLRVKPAPSTLTHRRAILDVLKRYGGIETFLRLQEPSSFISVAQDVTTARNIIQQSPMELTYLDPSATPSHKKQDGPTTFTISAFPGGKHPHSEAIKSSPLYGAWPQEQALPDNQISGSTIAECALGMSIPPSMASKGLRDWETEATQREYQAPKTAQDHIMARRQRKMAEASVKGLLEKSSEDVTNGKTRSRP